MLRPRIIPCLLVQKGGLVKTVNFAAPKYVGDPLNAVRIFNEKEVDELIVVDIDATSDGREPDYSLIRNLAAECRMPLCYGGGVRTIDQVKKIISLGVEKVAIGAAAVEAPALLQEASVQVGRQSVVAVLDVRKRQDGSYEVFIRNGTKATGRDPVEFARSVEHLGAGEVLLNSIDRDGAMAGYDLALARKIRQAVSIPMTVLGGAGSLRHIDELIGELGTVGAAAGSLFVFKGVYRAVLISYPGSADRDALFSRAQRSRASQVGERR